MNCVFFFHNIISSYHDYTFDTFIEVLFIHFWSLLRVTQSVAELAEVANSYVRSAKASFSKTLVADWDKTEF